MDYRKIGDFYYLRMDRDDEIISKILEICKKEKSALRYFLALEDAKKQKSRLTSQRKESLSWRRFPGCWNLLP